MRRIILPALTRIEGHGKIIIQLDDQGNVADARFTVMSLRGFERFCAGRPVEEMPRLVTRICGVCPWAHHLASAKAGDALFGAAIPPAARKLRELTYMAHYMHSHVLHFYFLSGPDLLLGAPSDASGRGIAGLLQAVPGLARRALRARQLGQMMTRILGGKAIHPDVAVPGGWSKPLTGTEVGALKEMGRECRDFAAFAIADAKQEVFPRYLDEWGSFAPITTGFLGTTRNGALDLYDGDLRMMTRDGGYEDFAAADYLAHISECSMPWSYSKFSYHRQAEGFSMEPDRPAGVYRAGALARINVCDRIPTPLAQEELEEFRRAFGRPAQSSCLFHWCRLIELVFAAERALELLDDPEITDPHTRVPAELIAGRGVGSVEAPRGTLIHDYKADGRGLITAVNLIVGTTHNNAAINLSLKAAARSLIRGGTWDDGVLNRVAMAVRAYDP